MGLLLSLGCLAAAAVTGYFALRVAGFFLESVGVFDRTGMALLAAFLGALSVGLLALGLLFLAFSHGLPFSP